LKESHNDVDCNDGTWTQKKKSPLDERGASWTKEEEGTLLQLQEHYICRNEWDDFAKHPALSNRTPTQIKSKWNSIQTMGRNGDDKNKEANRRSASILNNWSPQEDAHLLKRYRKKHQH
jgi:hypothetical protein